MNPTVDKVALAYERVAVHPASITIDRAGVVLPKGGHFQGIQRLARAPRDRRDPQLLVITSSSDDHPYFITCAMAEDGLSGQASSPVEIHGSHWNHAGGCQVVDHYLVVGIEDSNHEQGSEVQFWDLWETPPQREAMTIHRKGKVDVSTAGAVGLSSFGQGAALAVASYNAETVDFYTSEADPFAGSPLKKHLTWKSDDADKTGWIDQNFGHYQNVNLITQTTGELFMVAFDLGGGTDWMDLYSVHLEGHPRSALKKLAKKKMYCTNGCTFNDGSGIFIPSSDGFEVYAVNGKSGDHATGTKIYANHFPAT
jgi:hypothetical protein